MSDDIIDDFASMFAGPLGDAQRQKRAVRAQAERRAQLTDKQRKRAAVRTKQMNFRCSEAFMTDVKVAAKARDMSVADLLEVALAVYLAADGKAAS